MKFLHQHITPIAPPSMAKKGWASALLIGLLSVGVLASGSVHAQAMYKWVDKDGKTHFGDKPPTPQEGTKGGVSVVKKSFASGADNVGAQQDLAKKQAEQGKKAKGEKESAAESEENAQRQKEHDKNCSLAQEATRVLASGRRVSITDEKGERRFLEDKEIANRLTDAKKREGDACAPLPPPQAAPSAPVTPSAPAASKEVAKDGIQVKAR